MRWKNVPVKTFYSYWHPYPCCASGDRSHPGSWNAALWNVLRSEYVSLDKKDRTEEKKFFLCLFLYHFIVSSFSFKFLYGLWKSRIESPSVQWANLLGDQSLWCKCFSELMKSPTRKIVSIIGYIFIHPPSFRLSHICRISHILPYLQGENKKNKKKSIFLKLPIVFSKIMYII